MKAMMVEMVGRALSGSTSNFFETFKINFDDEISEFLPRVSVDEALQEYTLPEAVRVFEAKVEECLTREPALSLQCRFPEDVRPTYFQFSRSSISKMFLNLYSHFYPENSRSSSEFHVPDLGERIAILQRGYIKSSFERHAEPLRKDSFSISELQKIMTSKFKRLVKKKARNVIEELYVKHQQCTHSSPAWIIPRKYMKV